ncbi:MAG: hypothetical protein OQJ91_09930 [Motiliproteus sp.]|nr:hypothetical protein [Motiliproteus sp.]
MSNKGLMFAFIAAVFIAIGLYSNERSNQILLRLEAEGFTIDQRFDSHPLLLVDRQRRQIALAYPDRFELINYDQLLSVDVDIDVNDRDQEPRILVLNLQNHSQSEFRLDASTPEQVVGWKRQLQQWVADN